MVASLPFPLQGSGRVFSSWTCDTVQHGLPSSSLSLSDPLLTVARVSFQICSRHFSAYKPSVAAHCLQDETLDECLKPNIQGSPAWACSLPSVTSHHKTAPNTLCVLQHPALPGTGPPAWGVCSIFLQFQCHLLHVAASSTYLPVSQVTLFCMSSSCD